MTGSLLLHHVARFQFVFRFRVMEVFVGMIEATLCFLVDRLPASRVLLGLKKRGFGEGKFNGFGGKVEAGETVLQTAVRELYEETAVRVLPDDMQPVAQMTFWMTGNPDWNMQVYAYVATQWQGEPTESDEMRPQWFAITAVPYAQMWADDAYWLPRVLAGERLQGTFVFAADNETILEWSLAAVQAGTCFSMFFP